MKLLVPLIIAIMAISLFWFVSLTLPVVIVFIPGVIFTFILYLVTCYKNTPKPDRLLPLYLVALGIQFLHFAEEYVTRFTIVVPELLGQQPYPLDYWVVFNMIAYFVFILGGIILLKKHKELMIIPLFFILVGVLLNSMGHILLSLYVGAYFSGLYSALLYVVIGPLLIKRLFEETQNITSISTDN